MALTNIGLQKTPGRPVEITFAAETGTPSDTQEVLLIGHKHATSGTAVVYEVTEISNSGNLDAASGEAITKFGAGSELALMVIAAVRANAGQSSLPKLKAVPLASGDAGYGASDEALTAAKRVKAEFVVSPYDGQDDTLRGKLKDACLEMSGAQRVENNQFGSMGVMFNRSETDPSLLDQADTQFLSLHWLPDTGSPAYSLGESAAAGAARMAQQGVPFNPVDSLTISGVAAPASMADWPTVGAGLESETALSKGWTPWYVKPNGEVAIVRSVTTRKSPDGSGTPEVTAYYDVQDFQVLYFFRKTIFTRFSQPDFKQRKASEDTAREIKSETIRLMTLFEDQGMFQRVKELSKFVQVERNSSDRHRFDVKIPVNVVPGLHVIASNIEAGTLFDAVTV